MLLALWGVFRRAPFSSALSSSNPFAPSVVSLLSEIWNQTTALLSPPVLRSVEIRAAANDSFYCRLIYRLFFD